MAGEIRIVGMPSTLQEAEFGTVTLEELEVDMNRTGQVRRFRRVRMPPTAEAVSAQLTAWGAMVAEWNRQHPRAPVSDPTRPLNWCITEARWRDDFERDGWVKVLTRRPMEANALAVLSAPAPSAESPPAAPVQVAGVPQRLPAELQTRSKTIKGKAVQLGLPLLD